MQKLRSAYMQNGISFQWQQVSIMTISDSCCLFSPVVCLKVRFKFQHNVLPLSCFFPLNDFFPFLVSNQRDARSPKTDICSLKTKTKTLILQNKQEDKWPFATYLKQNNYSFLFLGEITPAHNIQNIPFWSTKYKIHLHSAICSGQPSI